MSPHAPCQSALSCGPFVERLLTCLLARRSFLPEQPSPLLLCHILRFALRQLRCTRSSSLQHTLQRGFKPCGRCSLSCRALAPVSVTPRNAPLAPVRGGGVRGVRRAAGASGRRGQWILWLPSPCAGMRVVSFPLGKDRVHQWQR